MTPLPKFSVMEINFDLLLECDGQIIILVPDDGKMDMNMPWSDLYSNGDFDFETENI
jgi:hypothetical protein